MNVVQDFVDDVNEDLKGCYEIRPRNWQTTFFSEFLFLFCMFLIFDIYAPIEFLSYPRKINH